MTPNADDLAKNLAALTERFAGLAAKLIQAAQELQTSGTLPAETLLQELAAARGALIDPRSSVLHAPRPRPLTAPPHAPARSPKAPEPEKCPVAEESGAECLGRALALGVTRGKPVAGGAGGPAPRRARPAPPPKGFEGTVQPAATAPTQRFARPPAPAPAMQEVAAAPPAPQDAGEAETVDTAALDDGAQWWVSAWARWTSAQGTIDFNAAVKQDLSKYAYLLSVPIQQAADYEEGLLAYGYSILLDFLERKSPGLVTRALNSLKTFVPGKAGRAQSAGAHLFNFLLGEAHLVEQYPEFVRSVLVAAVPEPGLWTQASILESTTETRVFTHPSARVGDPDHNSQRLTQDRQRFADHRFAVTLPSLTARFFAVAADLSEPRGIDVKLMEGRADSEDAWLLTIPPVDRVDLKSEPIRLAREGTSVPGLGKDYAALWVGVFNAQPEAAKNYELTLTLRKDARSSARRSAKA